VAADTGRPQTLIQERERASPDHAASKEEPMARTTLIWIPAALSLATGCVHHVYSPPARMLPLESAATLPPGEKSVQGELGGVSWIDGATASVRARRGFTESLDGSVEGSVLHVGRKSVAGTHPNAYSVRAGAKYLAQQWLAFVGGVGGGASSAGGFVSPDVAAIVAWENRFAVPFLSVRGSLSYPVGAREVNVTGTSDTATFVGTPGRTWIYGATAGVRVPWGSQAPGAARGSFLAGLGATHLSDSSDDQGLVQLALGAELVF
jgi:hypothetical protein